MKQFTPNMAIGGGDDDTTSYHSRSNTYQRNLKKRRQSKHAFLQQRQETLNDGTDINTTVGSVRWVEKVQKFVSGLEESVDCEIELCQIDDQTINEQVEEMKMREE